MKIKPLFCKHDYKVWANIYGDLILDFKGARTVLMCPKCNKRKYIKAYMEAPLNYNHFMEYCAMQKSGDPLAEDYLENVFKNKEQYLKTFCEVNCTSCQSTRS